MTIYEEYGRCIIQMELLQNKINELRKAINEEMLKEPKNG